MFQERRIGAVLLAGGMGTRLGGAIPKQFVFLGPKRVYQHTLAALEQAEIFDEIVLVCPHEWIQRVSEENFCPRTPLYIVVGGASRQESSYRGLQAFSQKPAIVAIHDGVRPFISKNILHYNVKEAIRWGAVDTCIPSTDSLVHGPGHMKVRSLLNREEHLRGQTPQTFAYPLILQAHEKALQDGWNQSTDDCGLVLRLGHPVHIVAGSEENIKITTACDFLLAQALQKRFESDPFDGKISDNFALKNR